jgi:hypothetical protein
MILFSTLSQFLSTLSPMPGRSDGRLRAERVTLCWTPRGIRSSSRETESGFCCSNTIKWWCYLLHRTNLSTLSPSKHQTTRTPTDDAHKKLCLDGRCSTRTDCAKETSGGTPMAVSVNREAATLNLCFGSSGSQRSIARGSGGGAGRGSSGLLAYAAGPCQFQGGPFGRGKTKGGGARGRRASCSP